MRKTSQSQQQENSASNALKKNNYPHSSIPRQNPWNWKGSRQILKFNNDLTIKLYKKHTDMRGIDCGNFECNGQNGDQRYVEIRLKIYNPTNYDGEIDNFYLKNIFLDYIISLKYPFSLYMDQVIII